MNNITFTDISQSNGETVTFVIIENAPGEFTSMPKSVYEELQAKQNEGIK